MGLPSGFLSYLVACCAGSLQRPSAAMLAALLLLVSPAAWSAPTARELFDRYSPAIAEVRIVERKSGSKNGVGTGFFVGSNGQVVTNYHVIASLVMEPERYRARLIRENQPELELELQAFDVVNDLAVLNSGITAPLALTLQGEPPPKGERVFAFGNPYDIGMSIVEGTYNGQLEHARIERMYFSGAINPGMSGGPALLESGEVIGINVASASNNVSFLVPAAKLQRLLAQAPAVMPAADRAAYQLRIGEQLLAHQEAYFRDLPGPSRTHVQLGAYRVPGAPAPHFNCWGDAPRKDPEDRHEAAIHQCSTDDEIYLSDEYQFTPMWFRHRELHTDELSAAQFYQLFSWYFEGSESELDGPKELFTDFSCRVRFVRAGSASLPFKAVFCARAYREMPGLYDIVFKAAALGRKDTGLETALVLSAVSFETAERVARQHLEDIQWRE